MKTATGFCQPMTFSGTPNTSTWAGYDYLQWTGDVYHPGLDYNYGAGEQDLGKPVLAIANGLVEYIERWDGKTYGYGNYIIIKHTLPSGEIIYSVYCHLNSIDVKKDQEVSMGQTIGTCGGSGGWPSHLHLEIRKPIGKGYAFWPKGYSKEWIAEHYYDPYKFIEEHKMPIQTDLDICLQAHEKLMAVIKEKDEVIKVEREKHTRDNASNDAVIIDLKTKLKVQEEKNTNLEAELAKADTSKDCEQLLKNQEKKYVKIIKDMEQELVDDEITGSQLIDPSKESLLLRFFIALLKK